MDRRSGGTPQKMKPVEVFSKKAQKYARYRWDYAPAAVLCLFDLTGIGAQSSLADIGAGTGILTRHFLGKVKKIYAVEPNEAMRENALMALGDQPDCQLLDSTAESTGLAEHSLDLITVAEAFNWFDPDPTRKEFQRILKSEGWLARFRNYGTNQELGEALAQVYPETTDTAILMPGKGVPMSFYYGCEDFIRQTFPFSVEESWTEFFGALSSASFAPDEGHSEFGGFERAAKRVFERFSRDGLLKMDGATELSLERIAAC